ATRRPDDAHELALGDVECEIVYRRHRAAQGRIDLGDVAGNDLRLRRPVEWRRGESCHVSLPSVGRSGALLQGGPTHLASFDWSLINGSGMLAGPMLPASMLRLPR